MAAANGTALDELSRALEEGELDEEYNKRPGLREQAKRWLLPRRACSWLLLGMSIATVVILGLTLLLLQLVLWPMNKLLAKAVVFTRDQGARDLYGFKCFKHLHVGCISKFATCCSSTYWHSRFVDVRALIPLDEHDSCAVHFIPQLEDNLCYLVVELASRKACLIDPCDTPAVLRGVEEIEKHHYGGEGALEIEAILSTHKHWDHSGANVELLEYFREDGLRVYGHAVEHVPACTHQVVDGDEIQIGDKLVWRVIASPSHTTGSVMYHVQGYEEKDMLMTGDTIFHGSTGALFEGKMDTMIANFVTVIERCSPTTLLFPGHEYSTGILSMVMQAYFREPNNPGVFMQTASHLFRAIHRRGVRDRLLNIPVRLDEERRINPLFRMVRMHQRKIALPIYKAKLIEEAQAARTEDEKPEEQPEGQPEATKPLETLTVTHETARNSFLSVYAADFFALKRKLANGEISAEEGAEQMGNIANDIFRPLSASRMRKGLTLQESLKVIGGKVPDRREEAGLNVPFEEVVHRDRLTRLMDDFDEEIGDYFKTSVWTRGNYVTAQPLEKFLSGGINKRQQEMTTLLKNPSDDPKEKKWPRLDSLKACCSSFRKLGKVCNCKRPEDRLRVPENIHPVKACALCSKGYKIV